jgi:predicted molibdopterin-dependent oxidoreductase YjgC
MCDEGRFTYKEVDTHRVAAPRIGGETTSMEKALDFAAKRLAEVPKDLLGIVLNAQATNEDNYFLMKVAKALGITHVYLAGRPPKPERADDILRNADVNPNTAGARSIAAWGGGGKAKGTQQLNADIIGGSVRGLWILGDHVALDDEALAALAKLDVVYQSPHDNFLSDKVSVLLPAASWAEVHGTYTNAKGLVQRVRAAVEPPGEARPHYELIALIAKRLGVDVGAPTAKAIFAEMKGAVPEMANASFGREALPIQLRFAASRG